VAERAQLLRLYWRRIRVEGLRNALARIASDPRRLVRHAARIARGDAAAMSNPYAPSASREGDVALVAAAAGRAMPDAEAAYVEIERDREFAAELERRYRAARHRGDAGNATFDLGRFKVFYALVRLLRPRVVIETGVHDGLSTALMLRALERNGGGRLVSIDLPSTDLPVGVDGPGWLVPDDLKGRWTLHLGDARKLLPELARDSAPVDVFLHDSDHSRAHREFEFRAVKPFMSPNGLIVSDDDDPPDTLLDELAGEWRATHVRSRDTAGHGPCLGVLVPAAGTPSTSA
jgi:predicted O-methyltransferase YrrM